MADRVDHTTRLPSTDDDDNGVVGILRTDTMAAQASTVLPVTSEPAVVSSAVVPTTSAVPTSTVEPISSAASSVAPVSSIVPSSAVSSSAISSVVPTTTSSTSIIPSSTSTSTTPSPTPSTTSSQIPTSTKVVTRTSVSGPALVTPSSVSAKSSSASAAKATNTSGKGGIGGSGLPLGGLVGIIIGGIAVIAVIGLLVTRSMRKRARAKRTANRSSLFEPWPAPVAMEDEPYEKPGYDAPAESYPMHPAGDNYAETGYGGAYGHDQSQPLYDHQPAQPGYNSYNEYPAQSYGHQAYPPQSYQPELAPIIGAGVGAGAAAVGTGLAADGSAGAAPGALVDGSMVRVKVAFVRSLEDELAITPGQQLYLHQVYDDGWTLCEDQAQNRGVVPLSCLEPWVEAHGISTSPSDQALAANATTQRRSSLYAPQSSGYQQ